MLNSVENQLYVLHRFYNIFEKLIKPVNSYYCIHYNNISKYQHYLNNLFNDL